MIVAAVAALLAGCNEAAPPPAPAGIDVQQTYQNNQFDQSDTSDDEN